MYTHAERMKVVKLYVQYGRNMARVIREFGYPSRQILYNWYREFVANGDLRKDAELGYSKYSAAQQGAPLNTTWHMAKAFLAQSRHWGTLGGQCCVHGSERIYWVW